MLELRGISHGFGGRAVLHETEVMVPPGGMIGIGGPSGAGKTTLGRIMAGRLIPDAGQVLWQTAALPRGVPMPVQHAHQSPELTLDPRWTVARILANGGMPDGAVCDALGVQPAWAGRHMAELSGGERARVALARLILPTTQVLICDEITAQLDALAAQALWQALVPLARARGMALVVISHDAGLRRRICDINLTLQNGTLSPAGQDAGQRMNVAGPKAGHGQSGAVA